MLTLCEKFRADLRGSRRAGISTLQSRLIHAPPARRQIERLISLCDVRYSENRHTYSNALQFYLK